MRVELDLPDWVDERHIRVHAGIELVAEKLSFEKSWRVKKDRCTRCGKCCQGLDDTHIYPVVNGECIHLEKIKEGVYNCKIALYHSRACGFDPRIKIAKGECPITYERG